MQFQGWLGWADVYRLLREVCKVLQHVKLEYQLTIVGRRPFAWNLR